MKKVITKRNKDNNVFTIERRPLPGDKKTYMVTQFPFQEKEEEIIRNIDEKKEEYYTINPGDKEWTLVVVVNNQIKSLQNKTKEDNIAKLPLF